MSRVSVNSIKLKYQRFYSLFLEIGFVKRSIYSYIKKMFTQTVYKNGKDTLYSISVEYFMTNYKHL